MMTLKRIVIYLFLGASVLIHIAMLLNLAAHFNMTLVPPGWTPVKSPVANRPAHWARDNQDGFFRSLEMPYFESRYRDLKQKEVSSKGLMKVPPRKTSNFGLDLFLRDANNTDPGGDFFQLYQSGLDARRGITIYESNPVSLEKGSIPKLTSSTPFHPPNRYPPPFAYTFGLFFTLFNPWNALLVWTVIHEAALLYCIYLSIRIGGDKTDRSFVAIGMWLGFLPWYLELYMGQTTFILMMGTMVLAAWFLETAPKLFAHGAWLLTLITKPVSLLYAPVLFRMREYKVLFTGLILAVAGSAVYFYHQPDDAMLFIRWAFGQEMVLSPGNYGFQNFLYRFFFSELFVRVFSIGMIVIGLLLTFRWGRFHPVRAICLWIAIYFLGYAHVWQHHQVLLNAGVCLAFLMTGRLRYFLIWLIMTIPSPFYFFEGNWNWTRETLYLFVGSAPAVLFFLCLLLENRRNSSGEIWE